MVKSWHDDKWTQLQSKPIQWHICQKRKKKVGQLCPVLLTEWLKELSWKLSNDSITVMVHGWATYGILMLEAFPKHCLLIGCIGWIKRFNREQRWEWPIVNHNRICELIYFFWNWCIWMKMEFPMSLLPKISSLDWLSFGCFGWFNCFYFLSFFPPTSM